MIRPRPCIVCGIRVEDGSSRCQRHQVGGARARSCMVCGRLSQGNYCAQHEPKVDEAARDAANPYRRSYRDPEYARNRRHRYERARGRCEACGIAVGPGEWDCDHVTALRDGGTNAIENLLILCKPCHKRKTAAERRARKS